MKMSVLLLLVLSFTSLRLLNLTRTSLLVFG